MRRFLKLMACLTWLGSCAPVALVRVGQVRPAISPADVKVYLSPPVAFDEVATLRASSHSLLFPGGPAQSDRLIDLFKAQAARLGATGVLLEGFTDEETLALGAGLVSQSYLHNGDINIGVGGSLGVFKKTGRARAIYVAPH